MTTHVLFSKEDACLYGFSYLYEKRGYAKRFVGSIKCGGKKVSKRAYAHRDVMARVLGRPLLPTEIVDHVNFDTLDKRRENLRIVTKSQNCQHRDRTKTKRPGLRGAHFHLRSGKWMANVSYMGRKIYCGLHDSPEAAAEAARLKRVELGYFGEAV